MELLIWNINQRSSGQKIPKFVNEVIMDSKADIVVLTEFIGTANGNIQKFIDDSSLSEKYLLRYNTERKECEGSNGVLIAVKKGLEEKDDAKIISKIEKMNTVRTEQPNFLQLDMAVNGRLISVIGTRIRVTDYGERREQLLSLIDHINTLGNKNIIVAGDFNNTTIHGDENQKYSDKEVRESYRGLDTFDTYNYHIMKEDFSNNGMTVFTPEEWSWVDNYKNKYKQDHIIIPNGINVVGNYVWNFVNKDNGYEGLKPEDYKSRLAGYPDHAILTADVDI